MKRIYPIEARLFSALHIGCGTDINGNRITQKSDRKAYIPASLIKGMVRENFSKLWRALREDEPECISGKRTDAKRCGCMTCRMFGSAGFARSRIRFDRLESPLELLYSTRSNVSIDRHTRNFTDKALVFTEVVDPRAIGADGKRTRCWFGGEITVFYPPELPPEEHRMIEAVFVQAVSMVTNIGLGKSRGLGFVETVVKRPEGGWLCEER